MSTIFWEAGTLSALALPPESKRSINFVEPERKTVGDI
jgi:hypothetical protein